MLTEGENSHFYSNTTVFADTCHWLRKLFDVARIDSIPVRIVDLSGTDTPFVVNRDNPSDVEINELLKRDFVYFRVEITIGGMTIPMTVSRPYGDVYIPTDDILAKTTLIRWINALDRRDVSDKPMELILSKTDQWGTTLWVYRHARIDTAAKMIKWIQALSENFETEVTFIKEIPHDDKGSWMKRRFGGELDELIEGKSDEHILYSVLFKPSNAKDYIFQFDLNRLRIGILSEKDITPIVIWMNETPVPLQ